MAQQFNWPLLDRIFSDIKYLALQDNLPLEISCLMNPLKLSFIFSDYQMANDIVNKLLIHQQCENEQIFPLHIINFLISKTSALFFSELCLPPSDDIKKILLQEYMSIGHNSSDFIGGISLLMLLPKISLTPEISDKLYKKLIEEINIKVTIQPLILPIKMLNPTFQSLQTLYNAIYQVKEWVDDITINREIPSDVASTDRKKTLQHHLNMLRSYKNCYRVKILLLETLLKLIKTLKDFEQKIMIVVSNGYKNTSFQKELEIFFKQRGALHFFNRLSSNDETFYQNSLLSAKNGLANLSAACLLAEEDIEKIAQQANIEKANNVSIRAAKELKKPTVPTKTIKKNIENSEKSITITSTLPVEIEEKYTDNTAPWKQVTSKRNKKKPFCHSPGNKKNPPGKKAPGSTQTQPPGISNALTPIHPKNHSIPRRWDALKDFLDAQHKIIDNSKLLECGFAINIPPKVRKFFTCFEKNQLFLVGGAIRNSLRRQPINDFDFIALLSAETIKLKFSGKCRPQGEGRKTILVVDYHGYSFDVLPIENTSYREALLRDTVKTDMVLALLQSDCRQRDFTINALYWNPNMGIVDFCGGMIDLLFNRTITRIQSESKHFEVRHAVHILRALRFAAQLHLNIKKDFYHIMMENISLLYTIDVKKLTKEHRSLVAALGEIEANQLYRHYGLYDLLSRRIPLSAPTWGDFWSSDTKASSPKNNSKEITHIGKHIQSYLSETDLQALQCVKSNFTLFKPNKMTQTSTANHGSYLKNQI